MPYKNIVFIKLHKRLFNDHRWYMMSEAAQLNYIRLILFAAETYNKIPKNIEAIKLAFKTTQDTKTILETIEEIKRHFPKLKESKHFYYFEEFDEKTNYIADVEVPRKSCGLPKEAVEEEEEEEEEKEKRGNSRFEELWERYPNRQGKKAALRHFNATVKNKKDWNNIQTALRNYLASKNVSRGFMKNGSTWFNEWRDWIDPTGTMMGGAVPDFRPKKIRTCEYCGQDVPENEYYTKHWVEGGCPKFKLAPVEIVHETVEGMKKLAEQFHVKPQKEERKR